MESYWNKPKFLAPLDENRAEDDFTVLSDRETLSTLAKNICNELYHPTTIWDINRLQKKENPKKFSNDFRIESNIEYFSFRSSCRLFRHCAGPEKCYECDEFHVSIFSKGSKSDTVEKLQARIDEKVKKEAPPFFYDAYSIRPPKIRTEFERPVLEYHCPMLGYRELFFPIYYGDMVIGAIALGQSIVEEADDENTINKVVNSFFSKKENNSDTLFAKFLQEQRKQSNYVEIKRPDRIKNMIIQAHKYRNPVDAFLLKYPPYLQNGFSKHATMLFKNQDEFDAFIRRACKKLTDMEKRLVEGMKEKRKQYFKKITSNAVEAFFKQQNSSKIEGNPSDRHAHKRKDLERAWNAFCAAADVLQAQLSLKEVLLFGDGVRLKVEETRTKKIYPDLPEEDARFDWLYEYPKDEKFSPKTDDFICSLGFPNILENLSSETDKEDAILLVYPDIVLLLRVKEKELEKNKEMYAQMANAIGKGFSRICSAVALCAANFMKEQHVLTLRMNRHENAHIAARLSDNMRQYFSRGGQAFIALEESKRKLVVNDMQNTIYLISHMSSNIGLITGSINKETVKTKNEKVDVFDLLFKWQVMFRDQLKDRNLNIIIARNSDNNIPAFLKGRDRDAPRFIKTNQALFELLVYNLVDNAVKYAYRGSKIYLRWCRQHSGPNDFELTVSSFGPKMPRNRSMYQLYARGNTSHLHAVDGDGIGLYVADRVAELLGIWVSHTDPFKAAPYHVPLISWYLNKSFSDDVQAKKKQNKLKYFQDTHKRTFNYIINNHAYTPIEYEKILSDLSHQDFTIADLPEKYLNTQITRDDLTKIYLKKNIDKATWLTTFVVTVPKAMEHKE